MEKKTNISEAAQVIVDRYSAEKGTKVGVSAYEALDKIPNTDPSEAQWNEGDEIQMPDLETLKASCIVRPFNGRDLGAFAVDCNGKGKLLYASTLKKTVLEYKKDDVTGAIEIVRDSNGRPVQHPAATELTQLGKDVRKAATIGAIARLLAGKKIVVKRVEENLSTARFTQEVVNGVSKNVISGIRTTSLPYFDYA